MLFLGCKRDPDLDKYPYLGSQQHIEATPLEEGMSKHPIVEQDSCSTVMIPKSTFNLQHISDKLLLTPKYL